MKGLGSTINLSARAALIAVQLEKLADRFDVMVNRLADKKDLRLHANIDQFYYMQKAVELRLLVRILNASCPVETLLQDKIQTRYQKMYCSWKKDVRFLNQYLRSVKPNLTSGL